MSDPKIRLQALASRVRTQRKHLEELRRRIREECRMAAMAEAPPRRAD